MRRVTLQLPDQLAALIEAEAAAQHRTVPGQCLYLLERSRPGRPEVDGDKPPPRRFHEAIYALWEQTGQTPLLQVSFGTGVNRTTISKTILNGHVPKWPAVESMVRFFQGDVEYFRSLWEDTR